MWAAWGGGILYYYLAGRASEIERPEYLIARSEKSDIVDLWKKKSIINIQISMYQTKLCLKMNTFNDYKL